MVRAYWEIGREIVEDEQQGEKRAGYGKALLEGLSRVLTAEYGEGFNARNLRSMHQFYQASPNWNALRSELSWINYKKEGKFPLLSVTPLHCSQKQYIQRGGALKCHVKVNGATEQANAVVLCTGANTVVASAATRTGKIPVATNFFTTANA